MPISNGLPTALTPNDSPYKETLKIPIYTPTTIRRPTYTETSIKIPSNIDTVVKTPNYTETTIRIPINTTKTQKTSQNFYNVSLRKY